MSERHSGFACLALLVLCVSCAPATGRGPRVVVASSDARDQVALGKITVRALRSAGYGVVDKTDLGSDSMVRAALAAGNVDVCWEYTGVTWNLHQGHEHPIADADELFYRVREDDKARGITWLPPAPCQRTLSISVPDGLRTREEIDDISDLLAHIRTRNPGLVLCTPRELYEAPSGLRAVERVYGYRFQEANLRFTSVEEGYQDLEEGICGAALGFSTDAALRPSLYRLEDDRDVFQVSELAVAVRTPILVSSPDLERVLLELGNRITQEAMADLYQQTVIDGKLPDAVAKRFLARSGRAR